MASGTVVSTISQHLNGNGGKRLRPILLLLSAKLVGETNPSCIHLGAVVEMIHTATLVHDDIIDVAETRRGKPSTNICGAITPAFSQVTGSTCRRSRSHCESEISTSSTS